MKRIFFFLIVFGAGILVGALGIHFKSAVGYWQNLPAPSSAATPLPLQERSINPANIHSGEPAVRGAVFSMTSGGRAIGGVWECEGPAVIDFTFWSDERLYVLDGSVDVKYLGSRFTLNPGDTALFRAGTTATWDIPHRLKKVWVVHDPGQAARTLTRFLE